MVPSSPSNEPREGSSQDGDEASSDESGMNTTRWASRIRRRPRHRRQRPHVSIALWISRGRFRRTLCNERMNTFALRSLGWVMTRDICSEIACVALGGRRRISAEALRALGDRWRAVHASLPVDMPARLDASVIEPLATSLSKSETAVAEFVEQLLDCWPHLYSERALRSRCLSECVRVILSLALGAIIISCTPADIPIMRDSALVLFAIACWSVMTTIQLWRTHLLARRMSEQRRCPDHVPASQESFSLLTDRGPPNP
jgi:hypothetical protein